VKSWICSSGHDEEVYALAVSADGRWLASGSLDGTARLWDTANWSEVAVLNNGSRVHSVAFTPDGTRLACACVNSVIRFWDMSTHQMVGELDGHRDYVHQIAFSPDGTRLVSCSGDSTVRIWDTLSAEQRQEMSAACLPGENQ
jgi:WD40 repeat protein